MLESIFNLSQTSFTTCLDPTRSSHSRKWGLTGLLLAGLFLPCGEANASPAPASSDATEHKHLAANYGKIPLSFEPNKGQTYPSVQFLSRGSGYSLFLTKDEVVLNLERQSAQAARTCCRTCGPITNGVGFFASAAWSTTVCRHS